MGHTVGVVDSWDDYDDDYEDESLDAVRELLRRGPKAVTAPLLSVRDVAQLILRRMKRPADFYLEPSKLQALCYLVQGRHLGLTGAPAFREQIHASIHGPFIDELSTAGTAFNTIGGSADRAEREPELNAIVDEVVRRYGSWTNGQLQELVRNHVPWIQAIQDGAKDALIVPGLMRSYFAFQASQRQPPVDN